MECRGEERGLDRGKSMENLVYEAKKYIACVGEHSCLRPLWAAAGMG